MSSRVSSSTKITGTTLQRESLTAKSRVSATSSKSVTTNTKYLNTTRGPDTTVCCASCRCSQKHKTATEKAVPGYEYLKYLGKGNDGLSAIHLFRSIRTHGTVAIKEVPYINDGASVYHQIADEVKLVMDIRHQNIAKYYDFFVLNKISKVYIVMEYAKKGSLRQLIKDQLKTKKWFQQSVILNIIRDVACGMQYLNSKQILHCDLKPENILVGDDGCMKICDFGSAYSLDNSKSYVGGTRSYMAPEIFNGLMPDEKSEIWSLGIILYELCTFSHPFVPFTTDEELKKKVQVGLFKSMNCRLSGYTYDMQELVELMLQVEPNYRETLANILNHELFD